MKLKHSEQKNYPYQMTLERLEKMPEKHLNNLRKLGTIMHHWMQQGSLENLHQKNLEKYKIFLPMLKLFELFQMKVS